MNTVLVTAEWAIWGKQPNGRDDYKILDSSQGRLGPDNFAMIVTRFGARPPKAQPQVTIAGLSRSQRYLALNIEEPSSWSDGMGRQFTVTRCFCIPYAQVTERPVSYEALYRALNETSLPTDNPLTIEIPEFDPEEIASRVDPTVVGAAALLLTGEPVCIVADEAVPMLDRLSFLDAVAALLPYGMRTTLTASTWTSSTTSHQIRLSFAEHARDSTHMIPWGTPADIPHTHEIARRYFDLLARQPNLAELIGRLVIATEPLSFASTDRHHALALLNDFSSTPEPEQRPGALLGAPDIWISVASLISGMVISGVAGNAAYDLLKVTCKSVARRWSGRSRLLGRRTLRTGEAVELARAAVCLKFDIGEPDRLDLVAAHPITLRSSPEGTLTLRAKRLASLRGSARSWSCVFSLQEEGLPESMTILIQANPPDPEHTVIFLLRAT